MEWLGVRPLSSKGHSVISSWFLFQSEDVSNVIEEIETLNLKTLLVIRHSSRLVNKFQNEENTFEN